MTDIEQKLQPIAKLLEWLPEGECAGWLDAMTEELLQRRAEITRSMRAADRRRVVPTTWRVS